MAAPGERLPGGGFFLVGALEFRWNRLSPSFLGAACRPSWVPWGAFLGKGPKAA
ncbi:MAG: hypothetical protein RLZZ244_497 [Verrucomicrobiota bacterium]|jgi:hypothetical protein